MSILYGSEKVSNDLLQSFEEEAGRKEGVDTVDHRRLGQNICILDEILPLDRVWLLQISKGGVRPACPD